MTELTRKVIEAALSHDPTLAPPDQERLKTLLAGEAVTPVNLISEAEAARLLSCSVMHMSRWRRGLTAVGFPFTIVRSGAGHVRYDRAEILRWNAQNRALANAQQVLERTA